MFAAERTKKIREMLLEYRHVDVNTLCSLLSCSIATVRRDLDKLELEGFLTKAYGGAILNESADQHIVISGDDDPYYKSKRNVAQIASSLIEDGDIIFLGPGSTCYQLASMLKQKHNLTVVTNSLDSAIELADVNDIHVIVAGGALDADNGYSSTSGIQTIELLSSMYIKKAFFTVSGISIEYGYTVNSYASMSLLQTIMHQSSERYVIADVSKFGQRSLVKLADVLEINKLITNMELNTKYKEFFFQNKVKLYTSFDE